MARILVVEDESDILDNIAETLELENFDIIKANNGREGVDKALEAHPDLVVCDISMPLLDGFGVLLELRNHPETALTPFIFLTAHAGRDNTRKGMNMGADDYLTKPFTPMELINAVNARLERHIKVVEDRETRVDQIRHNIAHAMPHELRTPLTGILGCADFLLMDYETIDPQRIYEVAQVILRSGQRLQKLVENYLLYTQIELASYDEEKLALMRQESVDYADVLLSQVADAHAREHDRLDDLTINVAGGVVPMSHDNFHKVANELIQNAFHFSEKGTPVTVQAYTENGAYVVTITDQGRSMSADEIARIGAYQQFKREFYEQQGAGLGLTIAKRLTEIHGGTCDIASAEGQGTTITLTFQA